MSLYSHNLLLVHILLLSVVYNVYTQVPVSKQLVLDRSNMVDLVLMGCSGDLARRYLWLAAAKLSHRVDLRVIGTGRTPNLEIRKVIPETAKLSWFDDEFNNDHSIQYHPGGSELHLSQLCSSNSTFLRSIAHVRLFYLSLPPEAYNSTVHWITKHCRRTGILLRVVLEKPFGVDLNSAEQLEAALTQSNGLEEDEIYRVDHYLGKPLLAAMPAFRRANLQIDRLLNGAHTRNIEVGFLERLDLKGRTSFYNSVGVIRDVLQNHATEMLLSVLSELTPPLASDESGDASNEDVELAKLVALRGLCPVVQKSQVLLGQYAEYASHLLEETGRTMSRVPTFAAVFLSACSARWKGTSIVLTAGRRLQHKASFIRLRLQLPRGGAISPTPLPYDYLRLNPALSRVATLQENLEARREAQILILVDSQSDGIGLPTPAIVCSTSLACQAPVGMHVVLRNVTLNSLLVDNLSSAAEERFDVLTLKNGAEQSERASPYEVLMADAVSGRRGSFVTWPVLQESWRIWDRVLNLATKLPLRPYLGLGQDSGQHMEIHWHRSGLNWAANDEVSVPIQHSIVASEERKQQLYADLLLGVPMFTGPAELLDVQLADNILTVAHSILRRETYFHLALPGGTSAQELMLQIAMRSHPHHLDANEQLLDWSRVHVWLTDERCTTRGAVDSNAVTVDEWLLRRLGQPFPFAHLHHVLLPSAGGNEQRNDSCLQEAALDYEKELLHHVPKHLHYVVLGVGSDGHIASLFPGSLLLDNEYKSKLAASVTIPYKRITLTPTALGSAQHVALLLNKKSPGKENVITHLQNTQAANKVASARELDIAMRRNFPLLHALGWQTNVTLWVDSALLHGSPVP